MPASTVTSHQAQARPSIGAERNSAAKINIADPGLKRDNPMVMAGAKYYSADLDGCLNAVFRILSGTPAQWQPRCCSSPEGSTRRPLHFGCAPRGFRSPRCVACRRRSPSRRELPDGRAHAHHPDWITASWNSNAIRRYCTHRARGSWRFHVVEAPHQGNALGITCQIPCHARHWNDRRAQGLALPQQRAPTSAQPKRHCPKACDYLCCLVGIDCIAIDRHVRMSSLRRATISGLRRRRVYLSAITNTLNQRSRTPPIILVWGAGTSMPGFGRLFRLVTPAFTQSVSDARQNSSTLSGTVSSAATMASGIGLGIVTQ